MGAQHQEGPPVRSDALIQAGGGSRIGECPVTEVAVQAVARGGRPGGVDDQVGDVQVDAAVAVVIQPRRRLGAVAGQRPIGRGGQVVDPGGGCHFLEQRASRGNAASVLHQQVAQQQVGRSVRNVLAVQRPLDVVRVDVDVGVAVVVVVGEDGARHLVGRQIGYQVVRRLEAAIAQVAVQPRRVAGVAAHREQVGPAVGVHVDPVHAQAVRGACEEPLGADAGRGGDIGEADGRVPHHGRVRGGAFDVCHRCRGGHAQGGRLLRQEPDRPQHGKTAGHRDRPGAQRVGADPSPAERPREAPEGDRPAGRCREQQRRRRRAAGAEQQQQRHQRNLEQQRHVDQHPERGRDGDAGYAVAQEGVDGLRLQELDGGAAREPGDHHDRPHADRHATGRTRPAPQPPPHLRGPAQIRLGRGRKAQVTSLRLRGAARHARDQRAEQKGGGKPQQHAAGAQQRGEHHRDHQQRRHVEGGRAVHERQRSLDTQPAPAHGARHRDDAGRAQVHHRPEAKPLENAAHRTGGLPARTVRRCQERLGDAAGQEREGHADGDELQVGEREAPPAGEEARLRLRLDAEALEALRGGRQRRLQVGAHGVELGQAVERGKRQQDGQHQDHPDHAALAGRRAEGGPDASDDRHPSRAGQPADGRHGRELPPHGS